MWLFGEIKLFWECDNKLKSDTKMITKKIAWKNLI